MSIKENLKIKFTFFMYVSDLCLFSNDLQWVGSFAYRYLVIDYKYSRFITGDKAVIEGIMRFDWLPYGISQHSISALLNIFF